MLKFKRIDILNAQVHWAHLALSVNVLKLNKNLGYEMYEENDNYLLYEKLDLRSNFL